MKRLLHPFVLVVSAILVVGYAYIATRLTSTALIRAALALPAELVPTFQAARPLWSMEPKVRAT
jgi:hypothetical protein